MRWPPHSWVLFCHVDYRVCFILDFCKVTGNWNSTKLNFHECDWLKKKKSSGHPRQKWCRPYPPLFVWHWIYMQVRSNMPCPFGRVCLVCSVAPEAFISPPLTSPKSLWLSLPSSPPCVLFLFLQKPSFNFKRCFLKFIFPNSSSTR